MEFDDAIVAAGAWMMSPGAGTGVIIACSDSVIRPSGVIFDLQKRTGAAKHGRMLSLGEKRLYVIGSTEGATAIHGLRLDIAWAQVGCPASVLNEINASMKRTRCESE